MQKTIQLWQTLAASSALALAVPAFAQSQSRTADPSKPPAIAPTRIFFDPFALGVGVPGPSKPPATAPVGGESVKAPQSGEIAIEDKAATQADVVLNQRIRRALSNDSTLAATASKIHLESDNGEVTLHGSVATGGQKINIVNKISQTSGVKKVHDQLKINI